MRHNRPPYGYSDVGTLDAELAAVDTQRGDFFTLIEFLKPLAVGCNPHDLQIGQVRTKYGD